MRQIKLFVSGGTWHAEHIKNGMPDTAIVALFGTNVLPTPYLSAMPAGIVLDTIARLNGDAVVQLKERQS